MFLYQPQNGYCYNSDTHFLFNFICQILLKYKNIQGELLDIGSGSGILGLLIARDYKKIQLNQVEIQDEFIFLSAKNAQINNINTNIYEGDFIQLDYKKKFDYIVSNPPFYPSSVIKTKNENLKIARYNNHLPLEDFIEKASLILTDNGKFFFCYDVQLIDEIILNCKKYNLNIENLQFLYPKKNKKATLVMVYAKKNSKTLISVMPSAIMFNDNNNFCEYTNEIYKKCATYSMKY